MINEVRNTVLSILNKNNYGYISPSDFNLFASQAQTEMFEEAFSDYNKFTVAQNLKQMYEGYGDMLQAVEEVLEIFNVTKALANYAGNAYNAPSLITTGDQSYMISKVICYPNQYTTGTNTTVVSAELVDAAASFNTLGLVPGDLVVNVTSTEVAQVVLTPTTNSVVLINNDIFTTPGDTYAIYKASTAAEAEKITQDKVVLLNTSLLTSSSVLFPTYSLQGDKVTVMPISYRNIGQVVMNYFRYPLAPKWTYISLAGGEPVFDQTQPDYQDFELPNEYEYKLATKILQYSGVSIRESEVVQYAMAQEAQQQSMTKLQ